MSGADKSVRAHQTPIWYVFRARRVAKHSLLSDQECFLAWGRGTLNFLMVPGSESTVKISLSDEGRLLGHVAIGQRLIAERCASAGVPEAKSLALLHCVLGHHGPDGLPARRFGSAEALALFRINSLDAQVKGALEHGPPP